MKWVTENLITKWDIRMLDMAFRVARWSKDPKKKVGSILASPDFRMLSWGYNGLPKEVKDDPIILNDVAEKNKRIIHAEINAINNCPRIPRGWTMYNTKPPCFDCALSIARNQVSKVFIPDIDVGSKWENTQRAGIKHLNDGGIEVLYFEGLLHLAHLAALKGEPWPWS